MPKIVTAPRYCTMDWCDKPLYATGLCRNCYDKNKRGTLRDPRIPKEVAKCAFGACDREASLKELCSTHYAMQWNGRPLAPIRDRREAPERPGERQCKTCKQWKDREEGFYDTSSGGKQGECKPCMVKRNSANQARRKMERQGLLSA